MINNRGQPSDTSKLSRSMSNDIIGIGDASNGILGDASLKHERINIDAPDTDGDFIPHRDLLHPSSSSLTLMDATGPFLDNSKCISKGFEGTAVDLLKEVDTFEGGNEDEGERMSIATTVLDPINSKGISKDIDIDIGIDEDSKSEIFSRSSPLLLNGQKLQTFVHPSSFTPSLGMSSLAFDSSIDSAEIGFEGVEGEEKGGGGGEGEGDTASAIERSDDLNSNRHLNIRASALPSFTGREAVSS